MATTTAAPSPPRTHVNSSPATIGGAVLAVLALVSLVGAAALGIMHLSKPDDDGFYTTRVATLATPTHALVSDGLDIDTDGAESLVSDGGLGTLRVSATSANGKPVFVGIARTAQVDAYLEGVSRDDVTDIDVDPFTVQTSRLPGRAKPAAPADQKFWSQQASGSGTRTLKWPVEAGSWDVVVMNADGTPGVRSGVSVGARMPLIGWIAGGLLALGAALGAGAVALLVAGRRRG